MRIRNGHAGPIQIATDMTGESPVIFTGKWIKPLYVCSFIYFLLPILSFGHQLNYLHLSHPIKYHKLLVQDFFCNRLETMIENITLPHQRCSSCTVLYLHLGFLVVSQCHLLSVLVCLWELVIFENGEQGKNNGFFLCILHPKETNWIYTCIPKYTPPIGNMLAHAFFCMENLKRQGSSRGSIWT